jgi:hypothetical protein
MLIHMHQMLCLNMPQLLAPKDVIPLQRIWCPNVKIYSAVAMCGACTSAEILLYRWCHLETLQPRVPETKIPLYCRESGSLLRTISESSSSPGGKFANPAHQPQEQDVLL